MSLFWYVQEIAAGYDGLSESIPVVGDDAGSLTSNVPPVVEVVPDVSSGKAPLRVQFEGDVYDEDGEITSLEWDFEGDGVFEVTSDLKSIERPQKLEAAREGLQREHVYETPGIYHAVVRVTDDKEESTTASVTIQVYSDRPWLDITPSNKDGFLYQAQAGYEAFFGEDVGKEIKFELNNAYITYRMVNQSLGAANTAKGEPEGNRIWYRNVFPGVDIRYTVYEDLLLEEFVVYQPMGMTVIEQEFVTHGVDYKMEEDGSL
ncbi:MAG: PKD domain-containing protein, partial [Candidatus Methanofastidiosia archaeon]